MADTKKKNFIKEIAVTAAFALAGAVGMMMFTHFYSFYTVSGQSMEDTYHEGDSS